MTIQQTVGARSEIQRLHPQLLVIVKAAQIQR